MRIRTHRRSRKSKMTTVNPKDKLKGVCWICSDPAASWYNTKKYCKRCIRLKKYLHLSEKELIQRYRYGKE